MARFDTSAPLGEGPFITGNTLLLAAIVNHAACAIIGLDPYGIVISWNEAAARLYGRSAADTIGRPFIRLVAHDQRAATEALLRGLAEHGTVEPEHVGRHLDATGQDFEVGFTLSPVRDIGGEIIAASLLVRPQAGSGLALTAATAGRKRRNILVVEDEALIGLGLAAMLENAGFDIIGPAATVDSALALLDRHHCSLAILDINLRDGETSEPLARLLQAQGVPFFVTSGYLADVHPPIFRQARSFAKPVRARSLVAAVHEVLN